ncbi:transcription-repair coupling factor [Rhodovibrio salinarum]|uniref:transcription-repair coupling factor n=1 Tax=Rhodovibrio salinarum TaxID=1087 RepID=UPI0004AE9335|nr:transcription-repair coupling factor [Rhodovibrio salinarum]
MQVPRRSGEPLKNPLARAFSENRRWLIARAPEGFDAWLLGEAAAERAGAPVLHVARDDARLERAAEALAFFYPGITVLRFPAWDCLPYDRVSPHRDVVAQRVDTLSRLAAGGLPETGVVVLTTVNALLQRVPPVDVIAPRVLTAKAGTQIAPDRLTAFFAENGYVRSDTVGDTGEYAVRGGIVDVFPPGEPEPLRLDFFGDELESVRTFDPLSQRTTGNHPGFTLKPVSEVVLEDDTVERFRTAYREIFGTPSKDDPLYAAVSEGRPYTGMEHWLPLFYARMATLFDYLPETTPVTMERQVEESRASRLETIHDFYDARKTVQSTEGLDVPSYKPLEPERLYLSAEEWSRTLEARPVAQFQPYNAPTDTETAVLDARGAPGHDFSAARKKGEAGEPYTTLKTAIRQERGNGRRVAVAGYTEGSCQRLESVLKEHGIENLAAVSSWPEARQLPAGQVALVTLALEHGFVGDSAALISEQDILGERIARPRGRKRKAENFLTEVSSLHEGDLVVHVDHGIGRYDGLINMDVGGAPHDMLKVTYAGGDRLFVPVENIEVLSRYGSEEDGIQLDKLGQGNWQARKARVKERVKEIADGLIKIAADRQLKRMEPLSPPQEFDEFCARFPYAETDDQLNAIEETLADLQAGKPMDRLICGDVGFGKTEVAMRAAFVAAMNGKQVAVIVPTTLLARQHAETFQQRFQGYPLQVRQLSRLVTAKETKQVKQDLEDGKADIVVGTHALLGKEVQFRDLGMLIVDEEQHFGVKQKEKLKELRGDLHVLTLTATPIPRTLQLSLSGVREMSLISTPPVDRLAVRTFVLPFDPVVVREAIMREHWRGGQTFYVCPRIEDLAEVTDRLEKLVPEVKVAVAHGQMGAKELEKVMTEFYEGQYDVLLSTHIIESGLDVPTANTLIIHRADMYGLSQLYQLRGRIGRSKQRGYAYLTLKPGRKLTDAAEKRLHVMQQLDHLGAGFTLASHDMDIRGAGNLVGEEQSGHVKEVGIELYQQMLEEAVSQAKQGAGRGGAEASAEEGFTPQINIGTSVLIPERYVQDLNVRLGLYRRISTLVDKQDIDAFASELIDRFGPLPPEVENLLQVIQIKQLCRDAGVEKVDAGPKGAVLTFHQDQFARPDALVQFIQEAPGQVQLRPDHKLVYKRTWNTPEQRVQGIRHLVERLARLAQPQQAA